MTVIVAENTPDKVRGLLKRWFIEPRPNVFVGSVNRRIREKVLQYILGIPRRSWRCWLFLTM